MPPRRPPSPASLIAALALAAAVAGLAHARRRPEPAPAPPAAPPGDAKTAPAARAAVAARADDHRANLAAALAAELRAKHGGAAAARVDRGVKQAASLWTDADGDLPAFAREHLLPEGPVLEATFAHLEAAFEQLDGHFNEIGRELRRPTDLDLGPLTPVDPLLATNDPSAHLVEDLFQSRVAFSVLLNFPSTTLQERLTDGPSWSRRRWAEVRLAGRFARRVPAEVQQGIARAAAAADLYIAEYNIWMHHLVDDKGERLFPKGLRLITHWNLRDELKADYADPRGIDKQRLITKVMERIVTQSIPAAVINNPRLDWNPWSNVVALAPAAEVEPNAPPVEKEKMVPSPAPEADVRYARLLDNYRAARRADPFSPTAPTAIARSFEIAREIPEARVVGLLREVLESPLVPKVAALIERRLGRKLEPQDLWFNGFQPRSRFSEKDLDAQVGKRYPNREAFAADIPRILTDLGFTPERARWLAERIVVDPSRGAGHALQAMRRGDFPHLRTRIEAGGMNYKGYNIAVHELGHNVEQVFSLYEVDHTLLQGVPNSAFTEALAFVFQAKDMELLGLVPGSGGAGAAGGARMPGRKGDPAAEAEAARARALNDFWQTWEIAGVALVDIAVWHWMYDHPEATPAELREATQGIAREHWDRYYAPVLGGKGSVLLGIYSHMISYPLYLCDYPLGHMIAFQIEEQMKRASAPLGAEFERMAKFGSVTPDLWMTNATGAPVSAGPLLRATEAALR